MCIEREVEIVRVVGDVDFGLLGRGRTVEGRLLHELCDEGCRLPCLVVEAAVDIRRRVGAGWTHRRAVGNQTGILHVRISYGCRYGCGLRSSLVLAGHFAGHENQEQRHHQGHTEPHPLRVLPGSVVDRRTQAQDVPRIKSK